MHPRWQQLWKSVNLKPSFTVINPLKFSALETPRIDTLANPSLGLLFLFHVQEDHREQEKANHHGEGAGIVGVGSRDETFVLSVLKRTHRYLEQRETASVKFSNTAAISLRVPWWSCDYREGFKIKTSTLSLCSDAQTSSYALSLWCNQ